MPVVAVLNQKGGVGKTTFTVNAAAEAADRGLKVLVVDLDPQANATTTMVPDLDPTESTTINDVLDAAIEGGAGDAIVATSWSSNLFLLPSELGLAKREHDTSLGLEMRLRKSLVGVAEQYDLVLIDCPPSLGRLSVNGLIAADSAVLVSESARASVQGLVGVMETLNVVQESYNPNLEIAGIVVNRIENTREATLRLSELEAAFGDLVWTPAIPKRAAVVEAYGACVPVSRFDSRGAKEAAEAFSQLTDRLLQLTPVEA